MKVRRVGVEGRKHFVEFWYDPSAGVRSWVAIRCDENGYQVGESVYVGTRNSIDKAVDDFCEQIRREDT